MPKTPVRIEGQVAPGFESVRDLYAHNMATLKERNTKPIVQEVLAR